MQPLREITDRYLPEETLSSDSRLTVYTASDSQAGGRVAVELVDASRGAASGAAGRFLDAVSLLQRLRHASLAPVVDGGVTDEGELFLVRGPVEGRSFATLGGESPGQIVALLLQVIGALEVLWEERIFHGALSASTLWIVPGTERTRAQITGLGYSAWVSRQPDADSELGRRDDIRDLAAVACRLFGAKVTDPASPEPGVQLPLATAFELEEADVMRDLLERCLRRDPAQRPESYEEVRAQLCEALWGGPDAGASAAAESGAPPARLTFTTVPEYTLVHGLDEVSADEPEDEGEITKVVMLDELEAAANETSPHSPEAPSPEAPSPEVAAPAAPSPAAETAAGAAEPAVPLPEPEEILTPVTFVPTGEETGGDPAAPAAPRSAPPAAGDPPPAREAVATREVSPPPPPAKPPAAEPPPPPARSSERPAGPAARSSATGAASRRRPPWLIPAVAGGVALLLAVAALLVVGALLSGGEEAEPVRVERPAEPVVAEPVEVPATEEEPIVPEVLDARIEAALVAFVADDPAAAQRLLDEISVADQAAFSAAECGALTALSGSLERVADEGALAGLTAGFEAGDLARVQGALRGIAGREEVFVARYPQLTDDVDRARRAVTLLARARAAADGDRPEEALQVTRALMETFPAWQGAQSLRETAAVTIENQADLLFEQGRYEQALERLAALSAEWPDREGLERRDQLIRTRRVAERDVSELLTAAQQAGEDGRPDDGLALLSGVHATRNTVPRLAEVRSQLEEQLAELDRESPRIALLGDAPPEIGRDEAVTIAFRVADDFRVDRVQVQGRKEGGSWQALPHRRRSGDARDGEYEVEIDPDFHGNERVEYYVTVEDVSGHQAGLGGLDQPLEILRKRWFRRLLPR